MSNTIITKDGDMLDALCKKYYGREDMVMEVLDANTHLARLPPILEAGVSVLLPSMTTKTLPPEIRLWG